MKLQEYSPTQKKNKFMINMENKDLRMEEEAVVATPSIYSVRCLEAVAVGAPKDPRKPNPN